MTAKRKRMKRRREREKRRKRGENAETREKTGERDNQVNLGEIRICCLEAFELLLKGIVPVEGGVA